MAYENIPHHAKFPLRSLRIRSTGQLEAFRRNGKLRFPLSEKQVAHGGESDAVRRIISSVRGDVLYELEMAPGLWHEELLQKLITYSPLLPHIREALKMIEPSRDGELVYYPCSTILKSVEACDTVYI